MKAIPTIEDFKKLANDAGLVPMKHVRDSLDIRSGHVRGYAPEMALRLYQGDEAEPVGNLKATGKPEGADDADKRGKAGETTPVNIPEGWQDQSALVRTRLAKQIDTDHQGTMSGDKADEIIRAELARRAAAPGGGPTGAVNTGSTPSV